MLKGGRGEKGSKCISLGGVRKGGGVVLKGRSGERDRIQFESKKGVREEDCRMVKCSEMEGRGKDDSNLKRS